MPLIPSQVKRVREAVTVKLDKSIVEQLKLYAEFIDSTQEHVVNESLAMTFRRDKEFQDWTEKQNGKGASGHAKAGA